MKTKQNDANYHVGAGHVPARNYGRDQNYGGTCHGGRTFHFGPGHARPLRVLVLLFLGSSLFAADDAFFPWAKGAAWTYDTLQKEKKSHFDMRVVIDGPWKEGESSGMIMTQKDKRGTMREFQVRNEKGIFIQKLALSKALTPEVNTRFSPAVPRVIFPLTPGTKVHWEGRLKVRMLMDKPIIFDGEVVGWEEIEVPAGKFHCIKLHYHEKRGDDVIDEDAWYAEGVGQVKYSGGQYIKELKSYQIK